MQVKIALFLGVIGSIGAMEMEKVEAADKPQKLLLALAKLKAAQKVQPGSNPSQANSEANPVNQPLSIPPSSANQPAPSSKFELAAQQLVTDIKFFEQEYPELELTNALAYFEATYPTAYNLFFQKVALVKQQSSTQSSSLNTEQVQVDKQGLIIQFLQIMFEYRFEDARKMQSMHTELLEAHSQLEANHHEQIKKTTRARWYALGTTLGGAAVTLITGILTWYLHNCT